MLGGLVQTFLRAATQVKASVFEQVVELIFSSLVGGVQNGSRRSESRRSTADATRSADDGKRCAARACLPVFRGGDGRPARPAMAAFTAPRCSSEPDSGREKNLSLDGSSD